MKAKALFANAGMALFGGTFIAGLTLFDLYTETGVQGVLDGDVSMLSYGIMILFGAYVAYAYILSTFAAVRGRTGFDANLYLLNGVKITFVSLGLIGTVIGFMMALSGIDPSIVSDVNAIGPMVANLIDGMGVALTTTLLGTIAYTYAEINNRLLRIVVTDDA